MVLAANVFYSMNPPLALLFVKCSTNLNVLFSWLLLPYPHRFGTSTTRTVCWPSALKVTRSVGTSKHATTPTPARPSPWPRIRWTDCNSNSSKASHRDRACVLGLRFNTLPEQYDRLFLQATCSNAFSCQKCWSFLFKFHWLLFLMLQWSIHVFRHFLVMAWCRTSANLYLSQCYM